jgi:uncharacterized protein
LLALAQFATPLWAIHAIGATFTGGRLLHALGLSRTLLPARAAGMVLTWLGMLAVAGGLIWQALR